MRDTTIESNYENIKSNLIKSEYVKSISSSSTVPGNGVGKSLISFDADGEKTEIVEFMVVAFDYFETMQIPILDGRPFDQKLDSVDEGVVIVNKRWMQMMGWEDYEGRYVYWAMDESGIPTQQGRVIGISENFNAFSLHDEIGPLIFYLDRDVGEIIHIRIDRSHMVEVIPFMDKEWLKMGSRRPFEYSFISEDLGKLYTEDYRLAKLTNALSLLAIFMSGLGLLGLTSFIVQRKKKEIGIRKILGASEWQILWLLFKDITSIMLLSSILAIPLSWYFAQAWLNNFAFAVPLNISVFVGTVLMALVISCLTVAYHAIQASLEDPVDVLKYE
jgi:putative ABC transport system permease protein